MPGIIDLLDEQAPAPAYTPLEETTPDTPNIEDTADDAPDPFPVTALPPVLARMVEQIADVAGVPAAMSGPLVLAAASASIGRGCRVKSLRGRETRASLYVLLGKQSGSGGSGAFRLAMSPLYGFQASARRDFEGSMKPVLLGEQEGLQIEIEGYRKSLKGAGEGERASLLQKLADAKRRLVSLEKEMVDPLLLASDATPEGMANLLSMHHETLAHFDSDAGDAISSVLGKYNAAESQSESLWLKSFDAEPITIVRKNSGVIYLDAPCLSVCWVCTPAKVRELFQNERLCEAGLLPRFLVCDPRARAQEIPEDQAAEARTIPAHVAQPYEAAIWKALHDYRLDANAEPFVLDMTAEARRTFARDFNQVLRQTAFMPDPFQSRYTEQAIRLSLVCHLFRHCEIEQKGEGTFGADLSGHEKPLCAEAAASGLALRDWFARRQSEFLASRKEAQEDARWEKARAIMRRHRDGITARELYSGRVVATNKAEAEALLAAWFAEGRTIALQPKQSGVGRKVVRYQLAPAFA